MDRIWLKSYPAGVPADIDPKKFRSLIELFEKSIAKYRERPAFHSCFPADREHQLFSLRGGCFATQ